MKTIEKFLKDTYFLKPTVGYEMLGIRPSLVCKDGFKVSVQASEYHYSHPRRNIQTGLYTSVELGYPSESDDLITPYAEEKENPTETVYGYVHIEVVEELIIKHGGLK